MILVTGSAGFIGGHLVSALAAMDERVACLDPKGIPGDFHTFREEDWKGVNTLTAIFHLGAISDTTCEDYSALSATNVALPKRLAEFCHTKNIPFIYASSASVYGNDGAPLNAYARSKAAFDNEMLSQPPSNPWYGLRFTNVFGNGEEHKGKQASMVSQMMRGHDTLFDINAKRDFVYVDDVVSVMLWAWQNKPPSGIYDVGTGVARDFRDIPRALAKYGPVAHREIPMPSSLEGKYQFHTQADLTKLRAAGYDKPFLTLEQGIARMRT